MGQWVEWVTFRVIWVIVDVRWYMTHTVNKSKAEHLYSALHGIQTTLKRSGMDQTVLPATNTMPA